MNPGDGTYYHTLDLGHGPYGETSTLRPAPSAPSVPPVSIPASRFAAAGTVAATGTSIGSPGRIADSVVEPGSAAAPSRGEDDRRIGRMVLDMDPQSGTMRLPGRSSTDTIVPEGVTSPDDVYVQQFPDAPWRMQSDNGIAPRRNSPRPGTSARSPSRAPMQADMSTPRNVGYWGSSVDYYPHPDEIICPPDSRPYVIRPPCSRCDYNRNRHYWGDCSGCNMRLPLMFLRKRLPNGRDVPWNSPDGPGGGGEGSPRGGDGDQPIVNRRSTRASSLPPGNAMSRRRSPEWFARHGVQAMRDAWEQEIADMDPEDREDIMQNRLDRQTEAAGYEGRETEIVRNDRIQMKRVAASDEYTSASQARSSGTRIDGDSEAASQAPVPMAVRPPKAPPPILNRDVI